MDLFEYQARDLFEANGVPVLGGAVATTPEEAKLAAARFGGKVVVIVAPHLHQRKIVPHPL